MEERPFLHEQPLHYWADEQRWTAGAGSCCHLGLGTSCLQRLPLLYTPAILILNQQKCKAKDIQFWQLLLFLPWQTSIIPCFTKVPQEGNNSDNKSWRGNLHLSCTQTVYHIYHTYLYQIYIEGQKKVTVTVVITVVHKTQVSECTLSVCFNNVINKYKEIDFEITITCQLSNFFPDFDVLFMFLLRSSNP